MVIHFLLLFVLEVAGHGNCAAEHLAGAAVMDDRGFGPFPEVLVNDLLVIAALVVISDRLSLLPP
jgi:hypothetical protein